MGVVAAGGGNRSVGRIGEHLLTATQPSMRRFAASIGAAGRRRGGCPRRTRVHDRETRCKRRDGAWVAERAGTMNEPTGDGRVGSGGAVFATLERPVAPLTLQKQ